MHPQSESKEIQSVANVGADGGLPSCVYPIGSVAILAQATVAFLSVGSIICS